MKQITETEVSLLKLRELGLPAHNGEMTSPEALAAAVRRVASFACPASASALVRGVVGPLRGLVWDTDPLQEAVRDLVSAMVAYGDLLEAPETLWESPGMARNLLYAAPPSFVNRDSGLVILYGIAPDAQSPLPPELSARVDHAGHVRRLRPASDQGDLAPKLRDLGLMDVPAEQWLKMPRLQKAEDVVAANDRLLDTAVPSREIPGLVLLDRVQRVDYYRGRWVAPSNQSGRYVARREQAYGADLWCYVEVREGDPQRMIDLRDCNEAWHLQMAIDAEGGSPQRFRISKTGENATIDYFSPIPAWAQRRLDSIGKPIRRGTGSLFAYEIPAVEIEEERQFAQSSMWMTEME